MDQRLVKSTSAADGGAGETVIRRLIAGLGTEDIVVYDVSDCQLFGRRRRHRLSGELAQAAESAGCRAEVYQSVFWLTLVYFPVKPLGTYIVLPRQACDDPDGDADQFRAIRIPMDWRQVALHYLVAFSLVLGLAGVVIAWLATRQAA